MGASLRVAPAPMSRFERQHLRVRMERAIEKLLAALDALDGDPDLEDSDEDAACEDEGFDADREPAMGWSTVGNNGPRIVTGLLAELTSHLQGDYLAFDAAD